MVKKPSYEELEQRVEELEKEATKLKQSDSALKESEERYRAIVAAFDGLIYVCSRDYRVEFMNDSLIERTGYDATGELCYKAMHELDSVCPWCVNEQVFRGETVRWEVQSPKDNHWYCVVNTPIYHLNGSVSKQSMILDITNRKQMEAQLRNAHDELAQQVKERTAELVEANEELKQFFQTVTDAIMLFDAGTRQFIDVNEAALSLYGYSREEFLKLRHQNITAEPENSDVSIRQTLEGKLVRIPVRYHKKKDGTIFPVEISTSMFTLRNRKVLCGVVRDITERKQAEEALRLERDNLRNIFESIEDGIYIVNQQYDIQYVNPVLVKDFGSYEGIKCYKYFHDRDEICTWCKNQDVFAGKTVHWEWYSFKNERTFDLIDTPMTLPDGTIGKLEIFRDITERKRAEDLVRNLSQMLMQAQERERQMISYELHDSIAQNLSTLKIDCNLIFVDQPAISHELKVKMAKHSNLIDQTITAVRNLSYDLRPPALDEMGIVKALEIYCEEFSENSGLKVDFQSAGLHSFDMDSNTEIHIYRLVQEGLNNIRKHADATWATIKLVGASPNIILRIEDNGKGFDVKARELALSNEKRLGLRSMKERVNLLQGQMTIQSRPMQGTKIFIKIPFKERKSEPEKEHINH